MKKFDVLDNLNIENMTFEDIYSQTKCSRRTFQRYIAFSKRKYIDKRFSKFGKIDYNQVKILYESGKCAKEISEKLNISQTHIFRILNKCNAVIRRTGAPKGKPSGSNNYNWKGGVSSKSILDRTSQKYQEWRKSVFDRDRYSCQNCGDSIGGNLIAHHIIHFAKDESKRFDIDNGITVCKTCHKEIHKIR